MWRDVICVKGSVSMTTHGREREEGGELGGGSVNRISSGIPAATVAVQQSDHSMLIVTRNSR